MKSSEASPESQAAPGEREFEELTRITNELITTQRQLHKKSGELQRLNEEKNLAIGVVAHDLRNPLALMKMQSDLLLSECYGQLSDDHCDLLQSISEQGQLMLSIVNEFLDVAAIEAGSLTIDRERVDVVDTVSRSVRSQALLASPKGVTIEFHTSLKSLEAWIDPHRFHQVLANVIGNAVKYSPPEAKVIVYLKAVDSDAFEVQVQDFGPGIPEAKLGLLFEPFETAGVEATAGEKRTGLGLAIVRRIMERHGGSLSVVSEVGVGSVFSIRTPTGQPAKDHNESLDYESTTRDADENRETTNDLLRVLVVDDCESAAKMTSRMVALVGKSTVKLVNDGEAAVAAASSFQPHLILLDIELPKMNGRQVASTVRAEFRSNAPMICAITAHAGSELERLAASDCFDSVIGKPFGLSELRRCMDEARSLAD